MRASWGLGGGIDRRLLLVWTVAAAAVIGALALVADSSDDAVSAPPSPSVNLRVDVDVPDGFAQIVPRGFIEALRFPATRSAAETPWPDDADVIGVVVGDEARAYPISVLNSAEMVVDELGGEPILVTWCPVCGTALVHHRVVGAQVLDFGVQGGFYRNAMTWFDLGTESIWSQPLGLAIGGPRSGDRLELLPSQFTTWRAWREARPETTTIAVDGDVTGFDLGELFVVVDLDTEVRGYPVSDLRMVGAVNDVIAGQELAVVIDPRNDQRWAVFSRRIGGTVVELELDDDQLVDIESGSTFDPATGVGRSGPLASSSLAPLPALVSLPGGGPTKVAVFDELWPDADVWRP